MYCLLKLEQFCHSNQDFKKKCLLDGLDDIALSLEKSDKISSYEKNIQKTKPWMN